MGSSLSAQFYAMIGPDALVLTQLVAWYLQILYADLARAPPNKLVRTTSRLSSIRRVSIAPTDHLKPICAHAHSRSNVATDLATAANTARAELLARVGVATPMSALI